MQERQKKRESATATAQLEKLQKDMKSSLHPPPAASSIETPSPSTSNDMRTPAAAAAAHSSATETSLDADEEQSHLNGEDTPGLFLHSYFKCSFLS